MRAPSAGGCWAPSPSSSSPSSSPRRRPSWPRPGRRPAGRHRARRARGAAQARPQGARRRCASRPTPKRNPLALWVEYWELFNRLGEAQQAELAAFAAALERQLRRGPAAQRLAARARPAPRLGQLQRRVPALQDGRRPPGDLLLAGHGADRRARHQGRAASPPGWRRRKRTTAARCSPPSWSTPSSWPAPTSGRRSASPPRPASRAPRARPRCCSARAWRPASPRSSTGRPATWARRRRPRPASRPSSPRSP